MINRGIPVDTEIANSILAKIETIIKSNPDAAGQIDVMEIVISTLAEEATLKKLVAQKSSESSNSLTGITPTSSEKNLDKNPQPTNLALPQLSNNTQKANLRPPHTSRPASGAFFSVTRAHNVNANVPPPLTPGCPHPPEQARRSASLYTRHK
ncbi:MAG: hypothetical protein NTU49_03600 [Gammaproteobacteria bacterium]|nr:hypothetical protein [Gammaproteobacteria bacterium]